MEDLTGKQFGPYHIVAPLGEGGMAAVFKAYQPSLERYVAVKVLPRQLANDPQFVARFQREAKLLAQLQHPHILPVLDYGHAEGYAYIVMPFVQGGTLTDWLQGQPLPLHKVRQVISQIGDALHYAHTRGLIHRDVKPSNILVDESGNCLLTDFGLARMVETSVNLTATGTIIGTPAYMSPEQCSGQSIDARSDIYSLGIVLYKMATGRVPYRAETPIAVVFKQIHDPLPQPRSVNPGLPEAVEVVILRALSKNRDDRYQTADEMVRAIQAAIPPDVRAESTVIEAQTHRLVRPRTRKIKSQDVETQPSALRERSNRVFSWAWVVLGVMALLAVGGLLAIFGKGASFQLSTPESTVGSNLAVTSIAVPTNQPSAILFYEDFTTNRILQRYNVDVVGPWKVEDGKYVIQLNRPDLPWAATFIYSPARELAEWTNYSIETDVMCEGNNQEFFAGIGIRHGSEIGYAFELHLNANFVGLYTNQGSQRQVLKSVEFPLSLGRWYHLELKGIGNHLWAYVDEQNIIDFIDIRDLREPYGGVHLTVYSGEPVRCTFDNVKVEEAAP